VHQTVSFHLSCLPFSVTTAVVLLVIFAILAQIEILALNEAAEDEIIPNLDSIIGSLKGIEQGVNASYEATLYVVCPFSSLPFLSHPL